jgi:predicted TIM-barrel fold metal-dependent hydrolase
MKTNSEKLINTSILKNDNFIIDSHMHVFNYEHVPSGFLGLKLPKRQWFYKLLEGLTTIIGLVWKKSKDTSEFMDAMNDSSSIRIFERAISLEKENSMHVALMMNMNASIKGSSLHNFDKQVLDIQEVVKKYPDRCLPFLALNPLDDTVYSDFLKAFGLSPYTDSNQMKFFGVKIYPCLGYLPSHPILMRIFYLCEKYNIPVISHCSAAGVRYNKTKSLTLQGTLYNNKTDLFEEVDKHVYCGNEEWFKQTFNHPNNWIPVLKKFPNLKLDLAHFPEHWQSYIIDIIRNYINVYTDISYSGSNTDYLLKLNKLLDLNENLRMKILYGTDFYMVDMEGKYRKIRSNYLTYIDDKYLKQLTNLNPKQFLFY